jgi:hypothetical protein
MRRITSVLRRFALLALGLTIGCLAAEVALRAFLAVSPDPPGSPYVRDADADYRLRPSPPGSPPGDDYINSFGFRDREHPRSKLPGTFRILGIGDSFVYGEVPLAENFLRVAERRVTEACGVDSLAAEMVLLGLGGYSPENEVGILRSLGLGLEPDFVVLAFYVGNDVTGIPVRGRIYRGNVYYVGSLDPWENALRQSRLFNFAEKLFRTRIQPAVARWRHRSGPVPAMGSRASESASSGSRRRAVDPIYVKIEKKRLPVYLRAPGRRVRKFWNEAEKHLLDFDALCRRAGVPWLLVLIPAEIQVDEDVRRQVLEGLSAPSDLYDFDFPQARLRAFADANGIAALDLLPAMQTRHRDGSRLYIPNNTHWNEVGNRVAGELIGNQIIEHLRHALEDGNRP